MAMKPAFCTCCAAAMKSSQVQWPGSLVTPALASTSLFAQTQLVECMFTGTAIHLPLNFENFCSAGGTTLSQPCLVASSLRSLRTPCRPQSSRSKPIICTAVGGLPAVTRARTTVIAASPPPPATGMSFHLTPCFSRLPLRTFSAGGLPPRGPPRRTPPPFFAAAGRAGGGGGGPRGGGGDGQSQNVFFHQNLLSRRVAGRGRGKQSGRGQIPVGARAKVQVHGLGLGVVLGGKPSQFAADAAFAVAPEGQFRMAFEKGVDPHRAGLDAARRRDAGIDVLAPDGGGQAVQRGVGQVDGLVERAKAQHRQHRAKHLLPGKD